VFLFLDSSLLLADFSAHLHELGFLSSARKSPPMESTVKSLRKTHLTLQCENVPVLFSTTSLPPSTKRWLESKRFDLQVFLQTWLQVTVSWQHRLTSLVQEGFG